jgi:hypothetical protein
LGIYHIGNCLILEYDFFFFLVNQNTIKYRTDQSRNVEPIGLWWKNNNLKEYSSHYIYYKKLNACIWVSILPFPTPSLLGSPHSLYSWFKVFLLLSKANNCTSCQLYMLRVTPRCIYWSISSVNISLVLCSSLLLILRSTQNM